MMGGPRFGEAAAAAMMWKFFKFVVIPFGGICIGIGLAVGWALS